MSRKMSSELVTGDVVYVYGMKVRINEVHHREAGDQAESLRAQGLSDQVYWSVGTVLNVTSVEEGLTNAPINWLGKAEDGSRTWQIQGNDRATWIVLD